MELVITFLDSLPTGYLADLVTKLAPGAYALELAKFKDGTDVELQIKNEVLNGYGAWQ